MHNAHSWHMNCSPLKKVYYTDYRVFDFLWWWGVGGPKSYSTGSLVLFIQYSLYLSKCPSIENKYPYRAGGPTEVKTLDIFERYPSYPYLVLCLYKLMKLQGEMFGLGV